MAGYSGYSMSNNAVSAYEDGLKPLSKIKKEDFLKDVQDFPLDFLKKELEKLGYDEWHHTSSQYNKTYFYDPKKLEYSEELKDSFNIFKNDKNQNPKEKEIRVEGEYAEWGGTSKRPKLLGWKPFKGVLKGKSIYTDDGERKVATGNWIKWDYVKEDIKESKIKLKENFDKEDIKNKINYYLNNKETLDEYLPYWSIINNIFHNEWEKTDVDYGTLLEEYKKIDERFALLVLLGKLNYHVNNGGFYQYFDNGFSGTTKGSLDLLELTNTLYKKYITSLKNSDLNDLLDEILEHDFNKATCENCDGNGEYYDDETGESWDCDYCHGEGEIIKEDDLILNDFDTYMWDESFYKIKFLEKRIEMFAKKTIEDFLNKNFEKNSKKLDKYLEESKKDYETFVENFYKRYKI